MTRIEREHELAARLLGAEVTTLHREVLGAQAIGAQAIGAQAIGAEPLQARRSRRSELYLANQRQRLLEEQAADIGDLVETDLLGEMLGLTGSEVSSEVSSDDQVASGVLMPGDMNDEQLAQHRWLVGRGLTDPLGYRDPYLPEPTVEGERMMRVMPHPCGQDWVVHLYPAGPRGNVLSRLRARQQVVELPLLTISTPAVSTPATVQKLSVRTRPPRSSALVAAALQQDAPPF